MAPKSGQSVLRCILCVIVSGECHIFCHLPNNQGLAGFTPLTARVSHLLNWLQLHMTNYSVTYMTYLIGLRVEGADNATPNTTSDMIISLLVVAAPFNDSATHFYKPTVHNLVMGTFPSWHGIRTCRLKPLAICLSAFSSAIGAVSAAVDILLMIHAHCHPYDPRVFLSQDSGLCYLC